MKLVVVTVFIVASWAALPGAQLAAPPLDVTYTRGGNQENGELPLVDVTIQVNGVRITADQASVGSQRRELSLRGNVVVKLPDLCGEQWRGPNGLYVVSECPSQPPGR